MTTKKKITIGEIDIVVYEKNREDYISLTDMARFRDRERSNYIIQNWLRTRNALEFCSLWEKTNNPDFNCIEFDAIKTDAGSNSFAMTPHRWVKLTNARGIHSKAGRYWEWNFCP